MLGRPVWALLALSGALATVTLFVALNRPTYVWRVVVLGDLSPAWRVRALVTAFPLVAGRSLSAGVLLYLVAALVGTNLALLGYRVARGGVALRGGSGSAVGVALGTLGAGCAPCGATVLAGALSMTGVATGLAALPLGGDTVLLVAAGMVLLSMHWVTDGMAAAGDACGVDGGGDSRRADR